MKKYIIDTIVRGIEHYENGYALLRLVPETGQLPEIAAGQFVQVRIDETPEVFLRRPISVNFVDYQANELWLLVHGIGAGTRWLTGLQPKQKVNLVMPLGNGFGIGGNDAGSACADAGCDPGSAGRASAANQSVANLSVEKPSAGKPSFGKPDDNLPCLLVGGGVGTAPLLYLAKQLKDCGRTVYALLGARSSADVLQKELFEQYAKVCVTTEDGSMGEKGLVTQHSVWDECRFGRIYTCGPKPMMRAVAKKAKELGVQCEASLENMMACGLGACLCCVEDTREGHLCVCQDGPVFNTDDLKWL